MSLDLLLRMPPGLFGDDPPTNTVAPAIGTTAVIGTQITGDDGTWVPAATSYAYQWQRYTGGAWADITGATSKNYTPVDADFGLALRLVVTATPGLKTANSNSTELVQEAPAQSLNSEVISNGSMETGSPPSGWSVVFAGAATLTSVADERTGGSGSKSLNVAYNSYDPPLAKQDITLSAGTVYEMGCWKKLVSGTAGVRVGVYDTTLSAYIIDGANLSTSTSWNRVAGLGRARNSANQARVISNGASSEGRFDDAGLKAVTINTQLIAPSANMRLDQFYTLPDSPAAGTQVWLLPRIADWSAGNYWLALLTYTGSQWDIALYSVASFTRTSRIAATNIGTTNGVRVNMNGDQISLWTTADGGSTWTPRGTTITNTTYQTATGVNALWTSDVTPGNLVYAVAT